jgi:hypothetical protein
MAYASPYLNSALTDAGLSFPGMDSVFSPVSPSGFFSSGGTYGGSLGNVNGVESVLSGATRAAVPGVSALLPGAVGAVTGGLTANAPNNTSYANDPNVEEVKVSAPRIPVTRGVLPDIGGLAAGAINPNITEGPMGTEAVKVSADKLKDPGLNVAGPVASAITSNITDPSYDSPEQLGYDNKPTDPAEDPSKLDTIDKVKLALTGLSLVGGLAGGGGGGGSGAGGTVPAGFENAGKMPESFKTDTLPTGDDIPAYGGGTSPASRTARDMGDIDYNRYGFNPEKSFFSNVPQRAAKGGSMAVTRPSKSFAVQGAGDGRSDDIPALLSDGEYVMDAELVTLLGNGSNKAGAAQLDRFRANVRKHKGKELAKGRFSVNAKNPQAYMAGGRT